MDLTQLTFMELWKLYYQLGGEIFRRIWWILILIFLIALIVKWYLEKD